MAEEQPVSMLFWHFPWSCKLFASSLGTMKKIMKSQCCHKCLRHSQHRTRTFFSLPSHTHLIEQMCFNINRYSRLHQLCRGSYLASTPSAYPKDYFFTFQVNFLPLPPYISLIHHPALSFAAVCIATRLTYKLCWCLVLKLTTFM